MGEGTGIGMISIMTSSCSGMSGVKPEHVVGARVVPTKRDPPDMFPDLPLDLGDLLDPPDNLLFGLLGLFPPFPALPSAILILAIRHLQSSDKFYMWYNIE